MRIWIDIEDLQGNRYGAGPILTATGWEHTRRLDRAGSFAFEMPAADPRSDYVRMKRIARCWGALDGQVWEFGAGSIEHCELGLGANGDLLLKVSGSDLLRELANRRAGPLALYDSNRIHPAVVMQWDPPLYVELFNAYDGIVGDASTSSSVQLVPATTYLCVWDPLPFRAIHFVLGDKNAQADALKVEYWNATTGAWTQLTVTDETSFGGAPFAINGDVSWTIPADWGPRAADGFVLYEVRISGATQTLDAVAFADVSILRDEPCDDALGRTMATMAGSWSLDTAMGYDSIARATELVGTPRTVIIRNAFDTFLGTADDDMSDIYYGWWNGNVDDPAKDHVEATATIYDAGHALPGGHALMITHTSGATKVAPYTYADSYDPVKENTDYMLSFWARGDGTAQGRFRIEGVGPTASWQYLSPVVSTGVTSDDTWELVEYAFTTPVGVTSLRLFLFGADPAVALGTCYFDLVSISERQGGAVYLQVANESVLEVLIRIAETTGEHFILSPAGRQVAWLRSDVRNLNMQAVAAGGIAVESNADVVLIKDLAEVQDGYELATRVYPYGAGTGASRVTLAYATRAMPSGWSLHAAGNYICWDTAEAVLGRIDRTLEWPDISQVGGGPEATRFAANSLADRAYNWLLRHSATDTNRVTGNIPRSYALTVAKCQQLILPGFKLRLAFTRRVAGYTAVDINADLWVLASTTRIDGKGIQTVGLEVGTVDVYPTLQDAQIAEEFQRMRQAWSYGAGDEPIVQLPST